MKKSIVLAILVMAVITAHSQVSRNTKLPSHPRLLLLANEETQVMADLDADKAWTQVKKGFFTECDKILTLEPRQINLKAMMQLNVSAEYLRRVFYMSFAYRMTGEKKYLDHALVELRQACSFENWHPEHFLDAAELTLAVAIGYDWLYNDLSRADRTMMRNAIISKGLNPSEEPAFSKQFDVISSNWNQVCHAAMVCASIALWDDNREQSVRLINRAINNIPSSMKTYAPNGVFPEGPMYWEYGTNFNTIMLAALEKAFGTDFDLSQQEGFLKTGKYYNNMYTPAGHCFTYSDNDLYNYTNMPPAIYWLYGKTGDESILFSEAQQFMRAGGYRIKNNRLAPLTMIWGAKAPLSKIAEPDYHFYKGEGINSVAVMRSSWKDYNGTYLGVKLGTPVATHGHMDAGSFFIESKMVKWATDMGLENYVLLKKNNIDPWSRRQDAERWDLYRITANNHNMVTFDHQRQVVNARAYIDETTENDNVMSLTSNLSRLYAGQVKSYSRSYTMEEDKRCVIADDITTDSKTTMCWNLMSQVSKVTQVASNIVKLEEMGRTMYVIIDAPVKITWEIGDATPTHSYENKNKGIKAIRFTAPLKANSTYHFTATFTHQAP